MARWFIFTIDWRANVPPFARNLRVANARLRKLDYDAPTLTTDVYRYRWRAALLTARDVFRVLAGANAQPGYVRRWQCTCEHWSDCDAGLTDCGPRRAHRDENKEWLRCGWVDEDYEQFYRHAPTKVVKSKRTRGLRPMRKRLT